MEIDFRGVRTKIPMGVLSGFRYAAIKTVGNNNIHSNVQYR